jgi:hypothetical protein
LISVILVLVFAVFIGRQRAGIDELGVQSLLNLGDKTFVMQPDFAIGATIHQLIRVIITMAFAMLSNFL